MLRNLLALTFMVFIFNGLIFAQDAELFSVGDTKVNKSEFEYIYNKNNFNNRADYSKKSLDDYLNLYVNFRLKVKEALAEGLDKSERFKEELNAYEKQLLDSYLDKDILDKLVKVEYERSQTDINVSHIFFVVGQDGSFDAAYEKAKEVEKKIKEGLSFEDAVTFSDDIRSAKNAGNLGWFNSYQIAFPEVEEAIYNLKIGEVSAPVKSRMGYHILKVNDTRPARPKLKVAVIKRYFPLGDTSSAGIKNAEDSINAAYTKLKNKVPFENVVLQYSEDDITKENKGQLEWFGINTYAKVFEETAYSLNDGQFSKPFKTNTAWYIIYRMETSKPLSFEEATPLLKMKLPSLPVFQYESDKFMVQLRSKLNVTEFEENKLNFFNRIDTLAKTQPFLYKDTSVAKKLLQVGNTIYDENKFGKKIQELYYSVNPGLGVNKNDALYKNAVDFFIMEYYKNTIKENVPEYKLLMDEYRNGIMIFSLSEKNIWNKASEDSVGLLTYYNNHITDFNLKKRATVRTITTTDKKAALEIIKMLQVEKNITDDLILEKIQKTYSIKPQINTETVDENNAKIDISTAKITGPVLENGIYTVTQIGSLQPEKTRTFQECRGYVVAAYQGFLEKEWIKELKQKYPVSIKEDVLQSMVKK